ncbi:MAG TPA: alpha/beta fold hydrolase [Actinocrinis sp.]|jgi:surfactin synthase thioesterase subunit
MPTTAHHLNAHLVVFQPRADAALRLVCFPHAGGGASHYHDWARRLPPDVEALVVQLPGRESRLAEPPVIDRAALAEAVLEAADRPFALLGVSMGAWLAFDVARRLEALGRPPVRLIVSGSAAPPTEPVPRAYADDSVAWLGALGGIPDAVLQNPELLELVLPAVRADVAWAEAFHAAPDARIDAPVTVLVGDADPDCDTRAAERWRDRSSAATDVRVLTGGHFLVREAGEPVLRAVVDELSRTLEAGKD